MPDHTVFERLRSAITDSGKKLEDLRYWELLPLDEKERLRDDPLHSPPFHWLVGIADEIPTDLHWLAYGAEMALRPAIADAVIEAARSMNAVAASDGWSWRMRHILWTRECHPIAARPVSTGVRRRITQSHWRKASASGPFEEADRLPSPGPPLCLWFCRHCPYPPFVARTCPNCKSDEFISELE